MNQIGEWLHLTIRKITLAAATVFITFGSGVLVMILLSNIGVTSSTATVIESVTVTPQNLIENEAKVATEVASLVFTNTAPTQVTSSFPVTVQGSAVQDVRLIVRSLESSQSLTVSPEQISDTEYRFSVPITNLKPGNYQLEAAGLSLSGKRLITRGSSFAVQTDVVQQESVDQSKEVVSEVNNTNDEMTEVLPGTITLTVSETEIISGSVTANISTSRLVDEVTVYVVSDNDSTPTFLGAARRVAARQWQLIIDSTNLPDGTHRLQARAEAQDIELRSVPLHIFVQNSLPRERLQETAQESVRNQNEAVTEAPVRDRNETVTEARVRAQESIDTTQPSARPIAPTTRSANSPTANEVSSATNNTRLVTSVDLIVRTVLRDTQRQISRTIVNYLEENPVSSSTASTTIATLTELIAADIFTDERLRNLSSEAEELVTSEVRALVRRAVQLELAIVQRSSMSGSQADVRSLVDAIEITDSVVADVRSPREFGLMREDLLAVATVRPVVVTDEVTNTTRVFSEITGRAVPNSQVTLYIYSSPVMVTINTEADGTFTYIYEKELEDGDHEVYVALTNTNGAVVAKSAGFQFIKEAQAFSVVDEEAAQDLVPITASTASDTRPYTIVFAVSIVALGLLLLILGTRTRPISPHHS